MALDSLWQIPLTLEGDQTAALTIFKKKTIFRFLLRSERETLRPKISWNKI